MTSDGIRAQGAGFVVDEVWAFTNRATHAQTARRVERHYVLAGPRVVASPPNDFDVWPETSTQGWPSP